MCVDYDGRILAQADPGPGEKVVVAPINIEQLRHERERRRGHDMRAHLRSSAHDYMNQEWLDAPEDSTIDIESLNTRIKKAKSKLGKTK